MAVTGICMNKVISSIVDLPQGRQHNRILRLAYPHNNAPQPQFLVNQLDAVEGVSRDFEYTVELLCDDANVPLKDMHGKLLSIELVRGDGSLRYFTGYVFSFQRKKSDGSITFYEAKLGPWLKYLSLRKNNYLFHEKNLRDQTESIFADYDTYSNWDWHVVGDDLPMTDACQFDETDFNYLSRRWEAAGYLYWYEHSAEGHKLVVSDDSTVAAAIDGRVEVRFQRHGGVADEDAVDVWSPVRTTAPSSVELTSFDFKHSRTTEINVPTLAEQGNVPDVESYEYIGAYGCKTANEGDSLAQRRMEEFEGNSKRVDAEGNCRYVLPGRYLTLVDHFNYFSEGGRDAGKNEFLILSVHHRATNNYFNQAGVESQYRNSMTCTRKNVPWRPGRNYNSTNTKILAPQTATVVGPSGSDRIHTDEYGRVRVQFHWDRIGNRDERSSAWVRVASLWAGAELGAAAIPRVDSEVIVQWLDGNPDRPIITGAVFNESNMPPWQLSSQQALMGLRSRELTPGGGNSATGRSNHLVLDDTNGQIQTQLKSDHQHSQLSLGYITRIEDNRGRTDARGEGWELRTDGHGAMRAADGMLISTESRQRAESSIKDMDEAVQRLKAAREHHDALAAAALQSQAQENGQQHDVAEVLKAQNESIQGSGGKFPELTEPHLVLASAAGITTTSAQSTHIASGGHTALTTGRSLSIATGDSLFASIKQAFRLFVHKAGMKLVAANADIDIIALQNSVNVLAKLDITQTANRITLAALGR